MSDKLFLSLILFLRTDFGIFVAFLIFGITSPAAIISKNRLVTIVLFLSWLRSSSQFKIRICSDVNLEANLVSNKAFSSSDKAWEFFKSKDRTTFEETLFTFCPPAPLLRTALYCNSTIIFSVSKTIWIGVHLSINHSRFSRD